MLSWCFSNVVCTSTVKSLIQVTGALVEKIRLLPQPIFVLLKEGGIEESHFYYRIKGTKRSGKKD
ncbi:hypothetical protein JOC77_004287 [Peribacillus deserti]|uniref:Uncharacterized protein n=1 Tax=Peribacillus deserti TaxID=673318 RepID=A0ABS2QQS3_9BACI|nr:hypothetical protein [Peribacillus deserti]